MNGTVAVEAKPHWASKLNWLGLVQLIIGIAELVKTFLTTNAPAAQGLIGPVEVPLEADGIAWIVSGILTMLFRKWTNRPTGKQHEIVDVPVKANPGT